MSQERALEASRAKHTWGASGTASLVRDGAFPLCSVLGQVWIPHCKGMKPLDGVQRGGYKGGAESGGHGAGAAEVLQFVQPRAEELRRGLLAAAAPHRELCAL